MGIVRDVTVDQLTQAVGGIDTSGLVKDSTAQATNTLLSNINTTLGGITTNDPPTDTTQQSIASAISGLGTALGADKANISGDNIADKAAFRSNINAQEKISSNTATVTLSTTKYGTFYYADTTPTVATSRIISIVVTSSGGNNFADCIMTASGVIRVFGDYSGGSVTIKYFYV